MHPNPSAYAGTTACAIRPAKPSRYARVYTGTSPKPVIPDQRGRRFTETPYNNSLTSDFSSSSSATDASIFARLKSFIGRPWTISHFPPRRPTRKRENQTFLDGVTSVGTNGNAVPVVGRRVLYGQTDRIDDRIGLLRPLK